MNFITRNLKKAGIVAGLVGILAGASSCNLFDNVKPRLENPRITRITGPTEVSPGANYSIQVFAKQGNLAPVIEIGRGADEKISRHGYFLSANFTAVPVPGEEILDISAFSVVNGARHDTTYTIIRR